MNKRIVLPIVAVAAMLGFAEVANASPAMMNTTANVRNGPGTYYQIVNQAYRGQTVNVQGCQGGWCYINLRGPDGWVAARFLGGAPGGPGINFYLNFGTLPGWGPRPPGPGGGLPPPVGPGGGGFPPPPGGGGFPPPPGGGFPGLPLPP